MIECVRSAGNEVAMRGATCNQRVGMHLCNEGICEIALPARKIPWLIDGAGLSSLILIERIGLSGQRTNECETHGASGQPANYRQQLARCVVAVHLIILDEGGTSGTVRCCAAWMSSGAGQIFRGAGWRNGFLAWLPRKLRPVAALCPGQVRGPPSR